MFMKKLILPAMVLSVLTSGSAYAMDREEETDAARQLVRLDGLEPMDVHEDDPVYVQLQQLNPHPMFVGQLYYFGGKELALDTEESIKGWAGAQKRMSSTHLWPKFIPQAMAAAFLSDPEISRIFASNTDAFQRFLLTCNPKYDWTVSGSYVPFYENGRFVAHIKLEPYPMETFLTVSEWLKDSDALEKCRDGYDVCSMFGLANQPYSIVSKLDTLTTLLKRDGLWDKFHSIPKLYKALDSRQIYDLNRPLSSAQVSEFEKFINEEM